MMGRQSNPRLIVTSLALTKAGDAIVDAKAVLPFLLAAGGAPALLTGLLVPIRESGSLLPQAALAPVIQRVSRRRLAWSIGAVGQAIAVLAMAFVAGVAEGWALGLGIVGALVLFALSRSVSSIAFKDVMGRAVPAGARGRVTGQATSAAGAVSLTLGIGLHLLGDRESTAVFVMLLLSAAAAWLVAAGVFRFVHEEPEPGDGDGGARPQWSMLRRDPRFRRFVLARTLLLASALSPPYVVAMAVDETQSSLGSLGPFVIASGLAALLGGRIWGDRADRSSRRVMASAAGFAAILLRVFLLLRLAEPVRSALPLYVAAHFLLNVIHAGARVGRSTYVVDFAEGDLRTLYVGASNTAMGVLLLVVGAVVGAVASLSTVAGLLVLVAIGVAGIPASMSLPPTAAEGGSVAAAHRLH